jgi:hypothetical protein
MEKYIEILDIIENKETEWFELAHQIKTAVCKGLEELANYHFSNEASVPVSLSPNARTTVNPDFTINLSPPRLSNCYLLRSQEEFLKSLQLSIKLASLKLPLKQKLSQLNPIE